MNMDIFDEGNRHRLKLKLMGLGGVGKAAKVTKISYYRMSRFINEWIDLKPEEINLLKLYIKLEEKD
jgi:hypothetical protein